MNKKLIQSITDVGAFIGFVGAYLLADLMVATLFLVIWFTVMVFVSKISGHHLTKLQYISWGVIVILGGSTLLYNDESIIKWRTSVVNCILAVAFLGSHFIGKKTLLERIFAGNFSAPTEKVRRLNLFIVFYLLTIGGLNLFVAYNYSTAEWMKFKYFGLTVLHFMFMIFCFYFLKPHVKEYLDKLIAEENGQKKL